MKTAIRLAETSEAIHHKHAAIVYKSGRILGTGVNFYRNAPSDYIDPEGISVHAEQAAIARVSENNLKGATVYVARKGKCSEHLLSRPCSACYEALMKAGVKKVIYTD